MHPSIEHFWQSSKVKSSSGIKYPGSHFLGFWSIVSDTLSVNFNVSIILVIFIEFIIFVIFIEFVIISVIFIVSLG